MNEYLTVDPRTAMLLAIADDELVTGHRHGHWTGVAPSLEEDLAFSTISQDEINHADVWYSLIASARDPEGTGDARRTVDELGLGRPPEAYRHAVLCERPPRDFAYTLARHWAYDHADAVRLAVLADSKDAEIAAVATKLLHEERYHLEHADHWFRRLAHGGDTAAGELAAGLEAALPEALWLFEPLPEEDQLVADGLLPAYSASMLVRWLEIVAPALEAADLGGTLPAEVELAGTDWVLPEAHFAEQGGRYGHHTADFTEDVWPEMTSLYRAHPGASW
ncbi:MAG: phenylacetate-CoA oxygenase subunit PaaC [Actinobacteria bacterium]|nr:phenylacetate-CoA oxygenase subunit PaaC [Actinomycetota bacterium]